MSRSVLPLAFVLIASAEFLGGVIVEGKSAFAAEVKNNDPNIELKDIKIENYDYKDVPKTEEPGIPAGFGINTLEQALSEAYLHNPDLDSTRATLRQIDESVAQALSGWRPSITGDLSQRNQRTKQGAGPIFGDRRRGGGVEARQSIFAGGGTYASTRKAENDVFAGREDLLDKEQQTFLLTVQVYVDVLSRAKIVEFLKASEKVLEQTVAQTKARYEVGEVTRTEVAAAEAKAAESVARRVSAEGDLETARASFTKVIGRPPGNLTMPKILVSLPKSRQEAIKKSLNDNPALKSFTFKEKSSEYTVDVETAALLPQIDAAARAERNVQQNVGNQRNLSVTLSLTVPLYDKGFSRSKVRQAEQGVAAARLNKESARLSLIETITKAWENLEAALKSIYQYDLQIKATSLALEGVREEYSLGLKSLLDVLQIEDDWRQAQISWVGAKQNAIVSSYQILVSTGQLTVKTLKLDVPYYDPTKYYEEYHDAWFSLGSEEDQSSFPARPSSPVPHD